MTHTDYFADCRTSDEIKKRYRQLAFEHHPDRGGDTATMQAINTQYTRAMAEASRGEQPGKTDAEYADLADIAEAIRHAIEQIIHLDGLEIELCGSWVWVSSNTYANKDALKAAGYKFAGKKKEWFFAGVPSSNRGGEFTKDDIRTRYGSERVQSQTWSGRSLAA